jgi:hypothetical protein
MNVHGDGIQQRRSLPSHNSITSTRSSPNSSQRLATQNKRRTPIGSNQLANNKPINHRRVNQISKNPTTDLVFSLPSTRSLGHPFCPVLNELEEDSNDATQKRPRLRAGRLDIDLSHHITITTHKAQPFSAFQSFQHAECTAQIRADTNG